MKKVIDQQNPNEIQLIKLHLADPNWEKTHDKLTDMYQF
jgi:hypothetical protein